MTFRIGFELRFYGIRVCMDWGTGSTVKKKSDNSPELGSGIGPETGHLI